MMSAASRKSTPNSDSLLQLAEADPTPRVLGRYQLCFEVASGGMATVYLAHQAGAAGIGKLVALKRIHPHLAVDPDFVDMFLDEARITSRIQHPNVCSIQDFGEDQGDYYLTMEYLVGESLAQVQRAIARHAEIRRSERTFALVASIIAAACEGLHAAHELCDEHDNPLHVVHRDVSPQNIYLTYHGGVRVVDFGIASARNCIHHTKTGNVKGKFAYMAPEQMRGTGIDRRADVWSLGVVLWETLALKRLFKRHSDGETVLAVVQSPLPQLRQIRPEVPEALARIAHKALAHNPKERYPSARAMGRDLVRFMGQAGDPVDTAERGEWMEKLFPNGRTRQQQLVNLATQLSETAPTSLPRRRPNRDSVSSHPRYSYLRPVRLHRDQSKTSPTWRWLPWAASLGALLLAVLLFVGFWYQDPARFVRLWQKTWQLATGPNAAQTTVPRSGAAALRSRGRPQAPLRPRVIVPAAKQPQSPSPHRAPMPVTVAVATGATATAIATENIATAAIATENKQESAAVLAPAPRKKKRKKASLAAKKRRRAQDKQANKGTGLPDAAARDDKHSAEAATTRARSQQAAVKQGVESIATPGVWADVFVQGRHLGQTPGRFVLPVGSQTLQLQAFGTGKKRSMTVQVHPSQMRRVQFRF